MICRKCKQEVPDGPFCLLCGAQQQPERQKRQRGNGTGSVYKMPNGSWRAEVNRYAGGKRFRATKAGFRTKKEALAYLPQLLAGPQRKQQNVTMQQLWDEWSSIHFRDISKGKAGHYRTAWNSISTIHHMYVENLVYADLQKLVDERAGGYYPKADIKILLNQLYQYAIKNDYATKNYAEFIQLPPLGASKKDAFSVDELAALWADYQHGHTFTRYPLIMIYTGMRLGELRTLLKENIYLEQQYAIGGIKTEAGKNREIIFCDKIMPLVRGAYADCTKRLWERAEAKFYEEYWQMIERTGVRRLNPHCCRHTAATALAEAGVKPAIIKAIMGHANYSTTLGYTHIRLEEKLKAVNLLT